ncbi:hypothetical protein R1sor_011157 [Riccia sorocarpa]|uniref:Centromere protein S n=1 Tax=Riccia sorocarpa TaxID=122646 RepID=A0ABD3I1F9_9MARC
MLGPSPAAHVLLADLEEMHSGLHQLVVVPEKVAVANAEARHPYDDMTKVAAVVLAVSGDDRFVVLGLEFDPELGWRGRYHHEVVTVVAPVEGAYVLVGPLHAEHSAAAEYEDEALRDRILLAVLKTVESEAQGLHLTVTPDAMKAIGAIALKFLEQLARDVEMFAQHAGRKSVNMEDVLLAVRRNPSVVANLTSMVEELASASKKNQAEKLKKKQDNEEPNVEKPKRRKKDTIPVQERKQKKKGQDDFLAEKMLEFDEGERLRRKFMA